MIRYQQLLTQLPQAPKTWLITGVAGFIGSNLLETLLKLDQRVVGLDNFATGHQRNLDEVRTLVTPQQWARFQFINGDIRNLADCREAMLYKADDRSAAAVASALTPSPRVRGEGWGEGQTGQEAAPVNYVLHQAALGSVPRSLEDPITTNATNIDGFLNMLVAARDARVQSFTYAASSSTYGDHPGLPKVEELIGKPLSPYAVTKYVNELYADVFARCYGFNSIGLRYFNVFGKRQDPDGAYAAVIPKWTAAMIKGEDLFINGDGSTSRDFCYIDNCIQANLLAATASALTPSPLEGDDCMDAGGRVKQEARAEGWGEGEGQRKGEDSPLNNIYNVAVSGRTDLNQLFAALKQSLAANGLNYDKSAVYRAFRAGDVLHSQADISKAQRLLGYAPQYDIAAGIGQVMPWYIGFMK